MILDIADIYSSHFKIKQSTLSLYVFNDGKVLSRLKAGCSLTTKRQQKAIQWFADNWPAGVNWPQHLVQKPQTTAAIKAEYEASLLCKQAIELNADGVIANPKLFCQAANISRDLLRQLVRNYGNGGKYQNQYPKPIYDAAGKASATASEVALKMLVASGDSRFSNFAASHIHALQYTAKIEQNTEQNSTFFKQAQ